MNADLLLSRMEGVWEPGDMAQALEQVSRKINDIAINIAEVPLPHPMDTPQTAHPNNAGRFTQEQLRVLRGIHANLSYFIKGDKP